MERCMDEKPDPKDGPVPVSLAPGVWYHLPGTNVNVLIKNGPMVHLAYQVVVEPESLNNDDGLKGQRVVTNTPLPIQETPPPAPKVVRK